MRKVHSLAVFVLFAFVAITKNASTNKGQTNLKQISDDLRILSRVTNAIGLHFYSIQNGSYFSNILAETFRIPLINFQKVIEVKTAETLQELGRMSDEYEKFIVDQTGKKKWQLTEIETGLSLLEFFGELKVKDIDVDVTLEDLKSAAKSLLGKSIFSYCDGIDNENIYAFYWLFNDQRPIKYISPITTTIPKIFKVFVNQAEKIGKCVDEVTNLMEAMNDNNVAIIDAGLNSMRRAEKLASEFFALSSIEGRMAHTFEKILQTTKDSKMIWNVPSEEMLKDSLDILKQLSESAFAVSAYGDPIELVYTAGFRDASDWKKVIDDLKSPWFQKHIVQDANIKNLSDTLEPYRDIATVIDEMDSSWQILVKNITDDVISGAKKLLKIRRFAIESKPHKDLLSNTEQEFKKCMPVKRLKFDEDYLMTFQTQKQKYEDLTIQMNSAKGVVRELDKMLFKKSDQNNEVVDPRQKFQQLLNFTALEITTTNEGRNGSDKFSSLEIVNRLHAELKWFIPGSEGEFFRILYGIADVGKVINLAKPFLTDAAEPDFNGKTKVFKSDSEIISVVTCLNNITEDLLATRSYFEMIENLLEFPTDEIKQLQKFVTGIKTIQSGIESINKILSGVPRNRNLIPKMENSNALSENFGKSIHVLESMDSFRASRGHFTNVRPFKTDTDQILIKNGLIDWIQPKTRLDRVLKEVDELEIIAGKLQHHNLTNITGVFEAAAKIKGLGGSQSQLRKVYEKLLSNKNKHQQSDIDFLKFVQTQDLDFAKHSARLSNARITTDYLKKYFDEMFGRGGATTIEMIVHKKTGVNEVDVVAIVAGVVVSVAFLFFTIYGFTERGKEHYGMLWFYYFAKHEHYERRWRYSLFLDRLDGKNGLLDAINEGNTPNLIKALKSGAYIDAYNKFGNTALHVAIKLAFPDQVKLLIKNGADRSLPNYKNLLPIQLVPQNYDKVTPEKQVKFDKIKKIYKKMEKKRYRVLPPRKLPASSFHIYPDETIEMDLANDFMQKFSNITNNEPIPTTTHIIHPTDENGVLHTDRVDALAWIFQGAIHVKEQWMKDCLKDEKIIGKDYEYLIQKVKYKGVVYDTVVEWTQSMAKATLPYLVGVYVSVVTKECDLLTLAAIVADQGGTYLSTFPDKKYFTKTSRAYHHAHRGPLFLICDKTQDLDAYKNDPDGMYSVFTEEEFYAFMLKRDIHTETRINPPPVMIGDE